MSLSQRYEPTQTILTITAAAGGRKNRGAEVLAAVEVARWDLAAFAGNSRPVYRSRQKPGIKSTSTAKISSRPSSISPERISLLAMPSDA
jgi:hypothetical protein